MPETIRKFPRYIDGYYGTPVRISRTPREYPFRLNGDTTTAVYTATYLVDQGKFTPTAAGTVDPENAGFYLLAETVPEIVDGDIATFRRTYSNIPATQTVPSSIVLSKPTVDGTFGAGLAAVFGDFRVFQPDTSLLQYDAYVAQAVTSDSGAPTIYPTGGTYTITFEGDTTTSLSYSSSAGSVQSALNALASVTARGGVTVTGAYNTTGGLVVTFNSYAQITADIGSLTGGVSKSESLLNGGYSQNVRAYIPGDPTLLTTKNLASLVSTGTPYDGGYSSDTARQYHAIASSASVDGSTFTGGTFTVTIDGVTSGAIDFDASLADLQDALDTMAAGKYVAEVAAAYYNPFWGETFSWTSASILSTNLRSIAFVIRFVDQPATGGTYTLTAFTQTTGSLAYNASAGTVESALNGLSEVSARGGCVVTGDLTDGFAITFANETFTHSAASLTPTGCTITAANTDSTIGRVQRLTFFSATRYRDLYVAAHGLSLTDQLFVKVASGPAYYSGITAFSLPDANTIRLTVTAADAWGTAASITEAGRRAKVAYSPGAAAVPCRRITDYYLPGVSSGIASADDIPIPANQSESSTMLQGIFSGQGSLNIQVGELSQWRDSAILSLTRTTVRASDL